MTRPRLTEEQVADLENALRAIGVNLLGALNDTVIDALTELRDRRAAELTAVIYGEEGGTVRRVYMTMREMEVLRALFFLLNKHGHEPYAYDGEECERALQAMDKLLSGGG